MAGHNSFGSPGPYGGAPVLFLTLSSEFFFCFGQLFLLLRCNFKLRNLSPHLAAPSWVTVSFLSLKSFYRCDSHVPPSFAISGYLLRLLLTPWILYSSKASCPTVSRSLWISGDCQNLARTLVPYYQLHRILS